MTTPEFCDQIATEQDRIKARFAALDTAFRALNDERRALEEREQALEAVRALYQSSQETVDQAIAVQAGLCAAAAHLAAEEK